MYVDANLVRDSTRRELAQREQEMNESRAKREAERQRLDAEAEVSGSNMSSTLPINHAWQERRKQYDLIEKRLRLASANDKATAGGHFASTQPIILFHRSAEAQESDESKAKVSNYEEAMHKIQQATGVTDVQEVVHRFQAQGETQENLKRLQHENTELLTRLREVHCIGCFILLNSPCATLPGARAHHQGV